MIFRAFRFYNEIIFIFILSKKIFSFLRKFSSLGGRDEITKRAIIESQIFTLGIIGLTLGTSMTWFSRIQLGVSRKATAKRDCVFLGLITKGKGRSISSMQTLDDIPRVGPERTEGWFPLLPSPSAFYGKWVTLQPRSGSFVFSPSSFRLYVVIRLLLRAQPAFADSFIGFSLSPLSFLSPPPPPPSSDHTLLYCLCSSSPPRPFLLSRKIQSVRTRRIRAASNPVMQQISVNERERSKRKISVISLWNIMRRNKEASFPSLLR